MYFVFSLKSHMFFVVRWHHRSQPSGWFPVFHYHLRIHFVFERTIIKLCRAIVRFTRAIIRFTWAIIFRRSVLYNIIRFIYFGDSLFVSVYVLRLREDLLHVYGELGADYLREGEECAGHVHRVVDVAVPQL